MVSKGDGNYLRHVRVMSSRIREQRLDSDEQGL